MKHTQSQIYRMALLLATKVLELQKDCRAKVEDDDLACNKLDDIGYIARLLKADLDETPI